MDAKLLFQMISKKMHADFQISAQIRHSGSKGTVRENILRDFLADGRLPSKYGLGSGEIVGRIKDTSRQSDVIIYDKFDGVTLLLDEHTQVYPIDCVYGIVEVKSALSKHELIDSANKIAEFKSMSPTGHLQHSIGGGMQLYYPRPKPFGLVFSYGLDGNSLDSLVENLRDWEEHHSPDLWPNYICVLGKGVIFHRGSEAFAECLHSDQISKDSWPLHLSFGEDSLWNFYSAVHDLCSRMKLGPVELLKYYEPLQRVGPFIIDGRFEFVRRRDEARIRPNEAAIKRITEWCLKRGSMKYGDLLVKRFGQVPEGFDRQTLERAIYLYDPDSLPGLKELGENPFIKDENGVRAAAPSLLSMHEVVIDGFFYCICLDSLSEEDFDVLC